MAFLAVLTADGGVPIFTRSSGQIKSKLPFATVGTLNGVHMFSRLRNTELKRIVTPEEKIIWREYHDKVVLILITSNDACNDFHASNLMDNIFAAMSMIIGIDSLLKQDSIRLQKASLATYPLIDSLLNQLETNHGTMGDLTSMTDCLLSEDSDTLQECLNQFLDVADSLYGCLLIKGKVAIASKEWWTLSSQERVLVIFYINTLPKVLSREVLIYLPTSSPQNSNRLITLHLLRDVEVCVLCSSEPALAVLEEEVPKIWKDCFDLLKIASNLYPKNFPNDIELDKNMLGVMIINTDKKQSMCSVQPSVDETVQKLKGTPSVKMNERQEALRTLYKLVVGSYFSSESDTDEKLKGSNTCSLFDYGNISYPDYTPVEYYIYTEKKKCYVIYQKPLQIYIIYNDEIPHFAIRSVSYETLQRMKEHLFPELSI